MYVCVRVCRNRIPKSISISRKEFEIMWSCQTNTFLECESVETGSGRHKLQRGRLEHKLKLKKVFCDELRL